MRRLEIKLAENVPGPDGKEQVLSTQHTCSMADKGAARYAASTTFSRYFLELIRDMDRNLDAAIVEFKQKHKLP